MVILGSHLTGGLCLDMLSSPFINGRTTTSFSCSLQGFVGVVCFDDVNFGLNIGLNILLFITYQVRNYM